MKNILIIAGYDPGLDAGIGLDIITVNDMGLRAAGVITALTVQNCRVMRSVHPVDPTIVADSLATLSKERDFDAVKIGMVGSIGTAKVITSFLKDFSGPVVLDPVIISSSGGTLTDEETIAALIDKLIPVTSVITPNIPELKTLTGMNTHDPEEIEVAASELQNKGVKNVFVTGGHGLGDTITDLLFIDDRMHRFEHERLGLNMRGTGCILSSALTANLAVGYDMHCASNNAVDYTIKVIGSSI